MMVKRTLFPLLLAATLCAASAPARAVTIPWATDAGPRTGHLDLPLSLRSLSDALASAGATGFDGLRTARPQAGHAALAALVQAALDKMPWLAVEGRPNGLWTWRRNVTAGVAIYGPGTGGYSSFSWTRRSDPPEPGLQVATGLRPQSAAMTAPRLRPGGGGPGGLTPVPLPPTAPMLVLALAATTMARKRRAGRGR